MASPMPVPLADDQFLRNVPGVDGWKVLPPAVLYAKLGQGGMGCVYRGRHLELEIEVAVKCLKPSLVAEDGQFEARFRREAKLAAELTHENLVRLYELRRAHGLSYLILEFVDGETARDRVARKGPLREEEAATILLGAARGLAKAHRHREVIVHRDVKPENIMISREGEVKLTDLGIAKALKSHDEATLSTLGAIGTPVYMAPEQWEDAKRVGPATDIWALGVTLYFLLTGRTAVQSGTAPQVGFEICNRPFPDVRHLRADLSESLFKILERCTQRDPSQRFGDAALLARELEQFLGERNASLVDRDSGSVKSQAAAVSPPPEQTLKRMRIATLETHTPPPVAATIPLGDTSRQQRPVRAGPTASRRKWLWIGAAAVIAAVAFFILDRRRDPVDPTVPVAETSGPSAPEPVHAPQPAPASAPASAPEAEPRRPAGWEVVDPKPGHKWWANGVREPKSGIVFLLVQPYKFQMGSPEDEPGRSDNEQVHQVELTQPFYLAETEVTQAQYERIVGRNPSTSHGANFPVEQVDWNDARSFCQSIGCDLPTEAQWELACRAETLTPFAFGTTLGSRQANIRGGPGCTAPVKSYPANPWGFFDMHGNVWEWCLDGYQENFITGSHVVDPLAPTAGTDERITRGAGFKNPADYSRSARRLHCPQGTRDVDLGFRPARVLAP